MAGRRKQTGGGRHKKVYNAKQKMMNIQFRYSDVVSDYAQALLLCDGRFSLIMSDCSQAELHNLDKIEFDELMARLSEKDRASVLAMMPTIGVDNEHVESYSSIQGATSEAPPSSGVPGKTPLLISPRPTPSSVSAPSAHASLIDKSAESFGAMPKEEDSQTKAGKSNSQSHNDNKLATGDGSVASWKSLKSINGRLTASKSGIVTPRQDTGNKT